VISPANTFGDVTFTSSFIGNSPSYTYSLTSSSNGVVTTLPGSPWTFTGTTDTRTVTFSTGTYKIGINAFATNGTGAGSYFIEDNYASLTVGAIDRIGIPNVSLSLNWTISSNASTTTYVSGIPYYTKGITLNFNPSSLQFTNIYQTIARPSSCNVLQLRDGAATSNYRYSDVFNNFVLANSVNNKAISFTLASASSSNPLNIQATTYNINNLNGNVNSNLVSNLAYLGSPSITYATFPGLPVSSVARMAISLVNYTSSSFVDPNNATLSSYDETATYAYLCAYDPFTATFYSSYTDVSLIKYNYYRPPFSGYPIQPAKYLVLRFITTAPLSNFVINLPNSSGVQEVYVQWESLSTTVWYNAKTLYTEPRGCASSTFNTIQRLPVRLPQGSSLSAASTINIIVYFAGSIPSVALSYI
jgi:hypothetical protein